MGEEGGGAVVGQGEVGVGVDGGPVDGVERPAGAVGCPGLAQVERVEYDVGVFIRSVPGLVGLGVNEELVIVAMGKDRVVDDSRGVVIG